MTMKKNDVLQAVKFLAVGVVNTLLDYGLFYLFLSVCGLDKNLAQVFATALAITNSYLVNRYWTFEKTGGVKAGEIARFLLVNGVSLLTTLLCLNVFYDVLALYRVFNHLLALCGVTYQLSGDVAILFCKVLAMPFSLAVNFLGNRLWVFRKK